MIQSIQRATAILRSFTESEPELGVTEISRRLALHKSTVSRILTTLEHEGLVSQNPESAKYRLGVGLVSLAGVALGRLDARGASQPYLNGLVALSQETVNVTILDGQECVNIERVASPKPIQYVGWIGRRMPLHCTASGKVLLAYTHAKNRSKLLDTRLKRYTKWTIVDRTVLKASLERIRACQYAIVHEEFERGFSAIAAPIFNHSRHAVATISISGPTFRLAGSAIEAFVEPLLQTTAQISAEMGFSGSLDPLSGSRRLLRHGDEV
jgi:DNA-binding IclR family transcriptional regulator